MPKAPKKWKKRSKSSKANARVPPKPGMKSLRGMPVQAFLFAAAKQIETPASHCNVFQIAFANTTVPLIPFETHRGRVASSYASETKPETVKVMGWFFQQIVHFVDFCIKFRSSKKSLKLLQLVIAFFVHIRLV